MKAVICPTTCPAKWFAARLRLMGLAFVLIVSLAFAGPEALDGIKAYQRFIGTDGACAWPQLTSLPKGEMAVLIWRHSNHGLTEGAAECWVSSDRGTTWRHAEHGAATNRMNFAGVRAAGFVYIAVVSDWSKPPSLREDAHLAGINHKEANTLPAT